MLKKLKPKSEFSRNVLTLMTGTTIAQAIPIAISPILTRIYTPEDFGVFALYIGIVSFIAIIVTARYEMAIVLPSTDKEAINIVALSFLIMIFIVTFLSIAIFFFKSQILTLLNAQEVGNLLYLAPVSILLAGLNQIFNYWANRKKNFKSMSSAQIGQSIGVGAGQSSFGFLTLNGGLVLGNIFGRFISAYILIKNFITRDKSSLKYINKSMMINQMKEHKDFPLVNSFHAFSDILRTSGSVMLISSFFGTTILGFYALSLRVLQVPVGILSSALGQVLYPKFTALHNEKKSLYPYVKKVFLVLIAIALPVFGTLYVIAPDLFAFVFGERWRVAGEYSRILVPYLFMNFLISPISSIPIILNKQKEFFYIALIGNVVMPSIIYTMYIQEYNIIDILICISLFFVVYYVIILLWIIKLTKGKINEV
jgi:O-antigen/teichoic acid export membrane protein